MAAWKSLPGDYPDHQNREWQSSERHALCLRRTQSRGIQGLDRCAGVKSAPVRRFTLLSSSLNPEPKELACGWRYGLHSDMCATQQLSIHRDDDGAEGHQYGADSGGHHDPPGRQHAGGEGNGDDVVTGRPPQILDHLPVGRV